VFDHIGYTGMFLITGILGVIGECTQCVMYILQVLHTQFGNEMEVFLSLQA
jgi:hypothetical protein